MDVIMSCLLIKAGQYLVLKDRYKSSLPENEEYCRYYQEELIIRFE